MGKLRLLLAVVYLTGCWTPRPDIQELLQQPTGVVRLPAGVLEVTEEIQIPRGAHDLEIEGAPAGTVLRAADNFHGRAILSLQSASKVTLRNITFDGNRGALAAPAGLPPSNVPFADFYGNNGLLARDVKSLTLSQVKFVNIANYAVLISRSHGILIDRIEVVDSGSHNEQGRNNASGGVLLEEGTSAFTVRDSVFRNIRGNGVWTHSLYTSPRNRDGLISGNRFSNLGRDAIQVGHATNIRVTANRGERIGYPVAEVDAAGGGTPVAIDTAGNVDHSAYLHNSFREIDGKCIDLDGFHDGEVIGNTCVNRGPVKDYPFGHYGIVMNNANPDMQSGNILIKNNLIDGAKFGGIFVIGKGNKIVDNRLLHLNEAGCNENAAKFGCSYFPGEPALLESGIYLGRRAERPAITSDNLVEGNEISGYKMATRCIGFAPGVTRRSNRIVNNRCYDEETQ